MFIIFLAIDVILTMVFACFIAWTFCFIFPGCFNAMFWTCFVSSYISRIVGAACQEIHNVNKYR